MTYVPKGVCSRLIEVEVADGKITKAAFVGGCGGNTQGICKLVEGMDAKEAIARLRGIKCGPRPTSCPDQLSYAIEQAINE